ncbi:unnamed protein product [Pseudo-nitzschia multistriata]|uniref:Uncharacterized protein n=1 Tax=Pseudo-nitzschia multistriata TaxID=183589 RepID=A0A448YWA5_9STRA|nr:unnamed protein product [Pseudo-nitzschia multistriata]
MPTGMNDGGEDDSTMFGIPASPGSLMGSSIRSNQVHSFDIESESCSIAGENPGWRLGMPWFSNNNNNSRSNNQQEQQLKTRNNPADEASRYYGGIMKAAGEIDVMSPISTGSNESRHFQSSRRNQKRASSFKGSRGSFHGSSKMKHERHYATNRSGAANNTINSNGKASVPIIRTKSSAGDSIADFDESEWTPPDSSYGAACPVCGFISKRVRQMIEMTLITAMIFFLIYLLVTTSMKIAEAHRKEGNNNSSSTSTVVTNDDVYVEKYSNGDDAVVVDDQYTESIDDAYVDDAYINNNDYTADDDGGGGYASDQSYNNDFNYNNQNYNNYNRNRQYYNFNNDDFNGGERDRRQRRLRHPRDIHDRGRGGVHPNNKILDRIKQLVSDRTASFIAH